MQKERLALEQENHQTVQELKAEWDQLKGDPSVGTEVPATAGEEQTGSGETEKTLTSTEQTQNGTSAQTDHERSPECGSAAGYGVAEQPAGEAV